MKYSYAVRAGMSTNIYLYSGTSLGSIRFLPELDAANVKCKIENVEWGLELKAER